LISVDVQVRRNKMFEYMDKQIIISLSLALLMLSLLDLEGKKKIMQGAVLLYFALIGVGMINSYLTVQENIKSFKNGSELKCSSLEQEYSVSLKSGWSLKKHYFLKDSLLVKVDSCEEFDND